MSFYWIKTSRIVKWIFPDLVWEVQNAGNKIYLTFDDGPTPEITQWVLDLLKQYDAKATFFCIGKNIKANPTLFQKVVASGHAIGNHTYNHKNGWRTTLGDYIQNCMMFETAYSDTSKCKLFRPPYGKMSMSQFKAIRDLGYKVIMWDVLSADFDQNISKEKCLDNVLSNVTSGSIIVFHDSVKAFPILKFVLPETLKNLAEKGFVFEKLH